MTRLFFPLAGGGLVVLAAVLLYQSRVEPFEPPPPLPAEPRPRLEVPADFGPPPPPDAGAPPHPLATFTEAQIADLVRKDIAALGPLSIGRPNRGALVNGVRMPTSPLWRVIDEKRAFGTRETVDAIAAAIRIVNERFPNTPKLYVGHISSRRGGYLRPHRSHQSGRDVDLGYYYRGGEKWYEVATKNNIDLPRTWELLRALFRVSEVEFIFMDRTIESWIFDYAARIGEDPTWLHAAFNGTRGARDSLVRHTWGHRTHFHVRFASPVARESGWRAYPALVKERLLPGSGYYGRGAKSWR